MSSLMASNLFGVLLLLLSFFSIADNITATIYTTSSTTTDTTIATSTVTFLLLKEANYDLRNYGFSQPETFSLIGIRL